MSEKIQTTSVCISPEVKMANTKSLTESRLFLNTLNSDRQSGKANGKESKKSRWKKEDSILICKYGRDNIQRHSYVFNKYVLDYENGYYGLQFQCEYCGNEVFDKVNNECKESFDGWKQTGMSEVAARYCKKQSPSIPVVCIHKISSRRGLFVSGKEERG
jgi:hypothetical protein